MRVQSSSVSLAMLVAAAVLLSACNRGQRGQSTQPVSGVMVRPAPPQQASAPARTTVPIAPGSPLGSSTLSGVADAKSEPAHPKVIVSDHSQTLIVAEHSFRLLTHVQSIEGTNDETVEWWELRDTNEHVVYREAYGVAFENGSFESTVQITASSFNTRQGSGILVHGMDLPSAPESGGWVRVFGYKYGRDKYAADPSLFGPFGPPIVVEGEFLDIDTDSSGPSPVPVGGVTVTVMHDVLKFRVWTGNFNIVYPVLINWITGKLQPAWHCIESTSKGQVERCSYPITVEAHRDDQPTFVRLFPGADEGFTPKHVIVQPQSKIEYLEARTPVLWNEDARTITFSVNGDVWVKIRIDGVEGWIHSQEDFEAVGLPQAG